MKNLAKYFVLLLLVQCEPVIPQKSGVKKQLFFSDHEYEVLVGNVQMLKSEDEQTDALSNPVIKRTGNETLLLNFDLLSDRFENLSAMIYHCNKNWKRSRLRDQEFLSEINNYRVIDFDYSLNTVQPYVNYRLALPTPTISGNYVLAAFRRGNPSDVLFTRRFLVCENIISIEQLVRVSTTISKREENQQIEFSIDYKDLLVNIPTENITTYILQNHNWNTAKGDIAPTSIRANEGIMEYRNLDLSTNFTGGNEFRWTDLRTLDIEGRNVATIQNTGSEIFAQLGLDVSRKAVSYTQNFQDINGNYIIENNEPGENFLNSDYATVRFTLKSEKIRGNVFVSGRFNNWRLQDRNQMRYDAEQKMYYTNIFLKQGYYDYQYVVTGELPTYHFEGSHFQTENDYEILVYYSRPGDINDQLLGYKKFKSIDDF